MCRQSAWLAWAQHIHRKCYTFNITAIHFTEHKCIYSNSLQYATVQIPSMLKMFPVVVTHTTPSALTYASMHNFIVKIYILGLDL